MKKKVTIISLILVLSMVFTGCSFTDLFKKSDSSSTSLDTVDYQDEGYLKLAEYTGVAVDISVADSEIDTQVQSLIDSKTYYKTIKKGKAKNGDVVDVDYEGSLNGKVLDASTATGASITIGSNGMIEDLEQGIIGMSVGKTKTYNCTFPSDYSVSDLAGKKVKFKVTLNSIQGDKVIPELTDSFIADNTDYKTITEYRNYCKENLTSSKKENAGNTALETVVTNSTVVDDKYPEELLATVKDQVAKQFEVMLQMYYGLDKATYMTQANLTEEQYNQQVLQAAQTQTKSQMVYDTIADLEDITVTQEEIDAKITETATNSSSSAEEMRTYYKDNLNMDLDSYTRDQIIQEKVTTLVGEKAALSETPIATTGSAVN